MSYHVDSQDLLRQIGFNSLVAEARESLADVPGTLARVIEHSRSNSVIHTGAETFEARSMPALTRVTPIVVGDWGSRHRRFEAPRRVVDQRPSHALHGVPPHRPFGCPTSARHERRQRIPGDGT